MKPDDLNASVDDALIDRLVDGGMTPAELRAAVTRLDQDPGGWKRCALAFLEAQVLNESFRGIGQAEEFDPNSQSVPFQPPAMVRNGHPWLRAAASAVMFGTTFGIGWLAHGTRIGSAGRETLVHDAGLTKLPPISKVSNSAIASSPNDAAPEDRALAQGEATPIVRAVATIRFGPESSPTELPVLAGPGITEDWLTRQPPPVSEHGQAVLASQGYQVEQQRRFFTTVLADGRRVAIPVDHVQIQYTGNEPL
jgi:hypothetical protein